MIVNKVCLENLVNACTTHWCVAQLHSIQNNEPRWHLMNALNRSSGFAHRQFSKRIDAFDGVVFPNSKQLNGDSMVMQPRTLVLLIKKSNHQHATNQTAMPCCSTVWPCTPLINEW